MPPKPLHETVLNPEYSAGLPDYAELHCLSNFTFLRGASFPEELIERADELGYRAIAITDECSLSGVVRAHAVAKERDIELIIGRAVHRKAAISFCCPVIGVVMVI